MGYQRAQWHSGLTYQQLCETCKNLVRYTDEALDFRPWYPDGYVDCPVCKSHLRHNESYAIDVPNRPAATPQENSATAAPQENSATAAPTGGNFTDVFCAKCGNKYGENDRFCSKCGAKRN